MDLEQEYGKNRLSIKRCNRYYNIIAIFYLVVFGARIFAEIYSCFLGGSLFLLLGAFISAAALAAGFGGVYLHKDIFPIAAPFIVLLHDAIALSAFQIVTPLCFICSIVNILVNKKYRWLEQQDGFPYFNVRFRDQEIDSSQWNIKAPYTQSFEEIKKQDNNGQMDDL
ncbi:MAG: hypothetical protein IKW96_00640 [Ruminococcus sp.]|uniref:hypothetical protein n=1 Tax=Ruminococcus sp. TaxID=41978 RepID=UPI0025FF851A|nr:hypothetical protein [Ruminococcus sp.]MBR5681771.1 hypothetical protein [Ruminococcus sp.]